MNELTELALNPTELLANIEYRARMLFTDPWSFVKITAARRKDAAPNESHRIYLELIVNRNVELHANAPTFEEAVRLLESRLTIEEEVTAEREDYEERQREEEDARLASFEALREVV